MNLLIDTELKQTQCFVEVNYIRELDGFNCHLANRILYSNMDNVNYIVNSYIENEKNVKYTSKKKERRFGTVFKILLPKEDIESNKLVKIVNKFSKFIIQEEKGLKYFSYMEVKKSIKYLVIVFLEREYYVIETYKKYSKTMYRNKKTKVITHQLDPDAELVCTRGAFVLDEFGNKIKLNTMFKFRKTRKFVYSDGDFNSFMDRFKKFWTYALGSLKARLVKGKFLRRLNLKKAWNRFERRIVLANNWLIQDIQNELNELFQLTLRDITWYDLHKGSSENEIVTNKDKYELVDKAFARYRKIFTKGYFEHEEKIYKIQKVQCDQAEINLKKLKEIFEIDLNELRNQLAS